MATSKRPFAGVFFFLFGVTALLKAWGRWQEQPLSGWFYASLLSGVGLIALGLLSRWVYRKEQAKSAPASTALDSLL